LLIAPCGFDKPLPHFGVEMPGFREKGMKRFAVLGACLVLAACGGGPRYRNYGPPPPPPDYGPTQPYSSMTPSPSAPSRPATPPKVASAGPLNTAMIGSYMDNQEAELRRAMRGTGVLVGRPGDDIVLRIGSDAMFEGNSYTLSGRAKDILWKLAPVLRRFDHTQVFIDAYTDTTGSAEKNAEVSRKRAYTIGGQLVKNAVPLSRLRAHGYGEENLKIKTGDQVNEPRNRRIEIRIVARASG
jgi:outer membrane protein OmpA-like peptidoglycan-associated protein